MSRYPEIFVLRHGQTDWNKIGRHQGRLDSALTDFGRRQARAQSEILARLTSDHPDIGSYASPQGRARQTADIALGPLGYSFQTDSRLCEISFGDWQGLTFDEIAAGWPEITAIADQSLLAWHFQAPGGESFDDICDRCLGFLNDLSAPSIIVTHGITSRILRGLWLGQGFEHMDAMPGGQGCVYHLHGCRQVRVPPE